MCFSWPISFFAIMNLVQVRKVDLLMPYFSAAERIETPVLTSKHAYVRMNIRKTHVSNFEAKKEA